MRRLLLYLALAALVPGFVQAQETAAQPANLSEIKVFELPRVDLRKARVEDEKRQLDGNVAHYAVAVEVDVTTDEAGTWDSWDLPRRDTARWRVRLRSPGALSLSLSFSRYRLPEGARLTISSVDGRERLEFTARDNEAHGQLWTPPLLADDLILELTVPYDDDEVVDLFDRFELRIGRVHHGYAGFGEAQPLSGPCERDVACAESPLWRDVARSVGLVVIEGVRYCTGFMVNNTALDGKPFFVTAHHCGVTRENAASAVVMWNYESASCRGDHLGEEALRPSRHFQTGATLRAAYEPTDVALLELDDLPSLDWNVHYAGWDRSLAVPRGTAAIHHPKTDLKRLSLDLDRIVPTLYLEDAVTPRGDHFRVGAWELGTTEGGSSGAPLFNRDQRVIGQLHGGYASCSQASADWFGRFAVSWFGGGRPGERLSDWLDPLATESVTLDGLDAGQLLTSFLEP